jgi:hypothetical protein
MMSLYLGEVHLERRLLVLRFSVLRGICSYSQYVAPEGGVLIAPRLLHVLLAVTDGILFLMCASSVDLLRPERSVRWR